MPETNTKTKEYVPPTTLYEKGSVTVATYSFDTTDTKTGIVKPLEMVRITKVKKHNVDGLGQVEQKVYIDMTAVQFAEILHFLSPNKPE